MLVWVVIGLAFSAHFPEQEDILAVVKGMVWIVWLWMVGVVYLVVPQCPDQMTQCGAACEGEKRGTKRERGNRKRWG